jgi:cell division protein FtsW
VISLGAVGSRDDSLVANRRHRPDYMLVLISLALLIIGMVVVYAISPGLSQQNDVDANYYITKQFLAVGVGMGAFIIISNIDLKVWRTLIKPLVFGAGIATLIALFLPVTAEYPAHRWVRLGGLSVQAVEIIKFALIIWLAYWLAERTQNKTPLQQSKTGKTMLYVLGAIGFVVAVLQSDLGSAGVIAAIMLTMGFISGVPLKNVVLIGIVAVVATVIAISTSQYRRDRFATYLNPQRDCQDAGYQACQALIGIGSGGIFGKGLSRSVQAYGYTPEAANDSIFAIYGEMFGFVGSTVLLGLFIALFTRLKSIIDRAPSTETKLIVTGVLAWLSTQTLINIGAMIGVLPLKGITLPLVSYGGTSIIMIMAGLGLVFNVSRYTNLGRRPATYNSGRKNNEHINDWRRHGGTHNSSVSRRSRN